MLRETPDGLTLLPTAAGPLHRRNGWNRRTPDASKGSLSAKPSLRELTAWAASGEVYVLHPSIRITLGHRSPIPLADVRDTPSGGWARAQYEAAPEGGDKFADFIFLRGADLSPRG